MLPQSGNTHALLEELLANPPGAAFPVQAAEQLLALLPDNDQPAADATPEAWRCRVCGYIREGSLPPAFTCPVCRQPAEAFEGQGAAAPPHDTFPTSTKRPAAETASPRQGFSAPWAAFRAV
ncbi:rubredoxin-like domain-containing protein [uncultured Oscillibacter sp.]|uniref:rubredoxin-like domain-containing protein n=1 Tax=uncultured Oscillibacter sp. TaxID=876091 RepID=UPI00280652DA|nr:hypothetical protein [uncultured Oscillibacter sp.]